MGIGTASRQVTCSSRPDECRMSPDMYGPPRDCKDSFGRVGNASDA
jgi:hypothetical protein